MNTYTGLVPTAYTRFIRRDTSCPSRVLQVWWTTLLLADKYVPPENCDIGQWRDVPVYQPGPWQPGEPQDEQCSELDQR